MTIYAAAGRQTGDFMKEIGGYLELENFAGQEYYPDLLKFNLARTAIAWFLPHVGCKKLYFPTFICTSVTNALKDTGIEIISYPINADFTPDFSILAGQSSSGAQHNSGSSYFCGVCPC